MKSLVLIIPENLREAANALGEAMGHGPGSYSVALYTNDELTHYGLHTWATPEFVGLLEAGTIPPALAEAGFPEATFDAIMSNLTVSVRDNMTNHFVEVIAANGLTITQPEAEL